MSKLLDKMKKNSTIKLAATMDKSEFMNDVDETQTDIPALNIALSGSNGCCPASVTYRVNQTSPRFQNWFYVKEEK